MLLTYTQSADTGGVLKSAAREDFVLPSAPFFSTRTFHTYSAPVVFYVTFSVSDVRGKSGSKIRDPCMKLPIPRACA